MKTLRFFQQTQILVIIPLFVNLLAAAVIRKLTSGYQRILISLLRIKVFVCRKKIVLILRFWHTLCQLPRLITLSRWFVTQFRQLFWLIRVLLFLFLLTLQRNRSFLQPCQVAKSPKFNKQLKLPFLAPVMVVLKLLVSKPLTLRLWNSNRGRHPIRNSDLSSLSKS